MHTKKKKNKKKKTKKRKEVTKLEHRQEEFTKRIQGLIEKLKEIDDKYSQVGFENLAFPGFLVKKQVAVTTQGSISCGKSSLLNELMSAVAFTLKKKQMKCTLFPFARYAFTNQIWVVCYHDKILSRRVLFERIKGERTKFRRVVNNFSDEDVLDEFVEELRQMSDDDQKKYFEEYLPRVEVRSNHPCLRFMRFVDTPGRFESEEVDRMVDEAVRKSHVHIFVFNVSNKTILTSEIESIRRTIHDCRDSEDVVPLARRILFVANHTDTLIPEKPKRAEKFVEEVGDGVYRARPALKKMLDNVRDRILKRLNSKDLFNGQIQPNQIYFTCCRRREAYYPLFTKDVRRIGKYLLNRSQDLIYETPANHVYDRIMEMLREKIIRLESAQNTLFKFEEAVERINSRKEDVMKLLKEIQEDILEELLRDLKSLFSKRDAIMKEVCEQEIGDDVLGDIHVAIKRRKRASELLSTRFKDNIFNHVKSIYNERVDQFKMKVKEKVTECVNEAVRNTPDMNIVLESDDYLVRMAFLNALKSLPKDIGLAGIIAVGAGIWTPFGILAAPVFGLIVAVSLGLSIGKFVGNKNIEKFGESWREEKFQRMWDSLKQRDILQQVKASFIVNTDDYLSILRGRIETKASAISKELAMDSEEMKEMCSELYKQYMEMICIKHTLLHWGNVSTVDLSKKAELGVGQYGKVQEGTFLGKKCAVKIIKYDNTVQNELFRKRRKGFSSEEEIANEVYTLSFLLDIASKEGWDPKFCTFFSVKEEKNVKLFRNKPEVDVYMIFMERVQTTLANVIFKKENGLKWRLSAAIQIANSLGFLHSIERFHRDIKPGNIFIRDDGTICIGDFGFFKCVGMSSGSTLGTPYYVDPQIWYQKNYSEKRYGLSVDVFSFGVLLAVLFNQENPVSLLSKEYTEYCQVRAYVDYEQDRKSGKFTKINYFDRFSEKMVYKECTECTNWVEDLVFDCVKLDYEERPLMKEVYIRLIKIWNMTFPNEQRMIKIANADKVDRRMTMLKNVSLQQEDGDDDDDEEEEEEEEEEIVNNNSSAVEIEKFECMEVTVSGTSATEVEEEEEEEEEEVEGED